MQGGTGKRDITFIREMRVHTDIPDFLCLLEFHLSIPAEIDDLKNSIENQLTNSYLNWNT